MSAPTIAFFREYLKLATHVVQPANSNLYHGRRFFPPSSETSSSQEDATEEQIAEAEATANQLPSVPQTDPSDNEHAQKKQKQGRSD
jgi:hypothetical protein